MTTQRPPQPVVAPLRANPHRWDWYELQRKLGVELGIQEVPGVSLAPHGRHWNIHRTHLPLLFDLVGSVLTDRSSPIHTHEARARRASETSTPLTLRPHQQTGLDFIEPRRGVLVADEMRLGKTLTALLAHDPSRGPLVVIAPLSTRKVWLTWMKRLWPDLEPVVIVGESFDLDKLRGAPIIFGHYDIVARIAKITSLRPGTFIVDEAHRLSNPDARRTKAIHWYATVAQRVILLTGTPLQNTSKGLWALLAACNPGAWGRPFNFYQRYCGPTMGEYGWKYNGVSNEAEWALRKSELMIRRTWAEVQPGLPPIQRTIEMIDLDAKELMEIDRIAFELRKRVKTLAVEDQSYYRQATGLFKVPGAVDLALRVTATPQPVVLWTWHRNVANAIGKKISAKKVPAFVVTGDHSLSQRELAMDRWRETENGALVVGIDVGQEGIDLSHAHHAIFVEIDWAPWRVSQAEMRTFDASRPMAIDYLVLNHELDQALVETLHYKIEQGEASGMPAAGAMFAAPRAASITYDDDSLSAAFEAAVAKMI